MSTSKIKTERLQAFANYLSSKELVSKDFFDPSLQIGMQVEDGTIMPVNPVLFMAMFELPHIFPNDWVYNNRLEPIWKKRRKSDPFLSVMTWFGISEVQMENLFFHGMQLCQCFGGKMIDEKSTKHDLAFNVLELIKA